MYVFAFISLYVYTFISFYILLSDAYSQVHIVWAGGGGMHLMWIDM